jgi:hypothetical protein
LARLAEAALYRMEAVAATASGRRAWSSGSSARRETYDDGTTGLAAYGSRERQAAERHRRATKRDC